MSVKNITSGNFEDFIKDGKAVIDFYADWCNPCKIISPIVHKFADKTKGVKFAKVDVDKEGELAQRFQVMSVPTLLFFSDGEQVDRVVGVLSEEEFAKKIKSI